MSDLLKYNDLILDAFTNQSKKDEVVQRKLEIVNKVLDYHNVSPRSYLFVGFNPAIMGNLQGEVYVNNLSESSVNWLKKNKPNIKPFTNNFKPDCVIAFEEYLTFANSELDQIEQIKNIVDLSGKVFISTVRDYKNLDFKEKEYSIPAIVKSSGNFAVYSEIHQWDINDNQKFDTSYYKLTNTSADYLFKLSRRAAYFKQIAKFSHDAGGREFIVHKNLMYKSLLRKNYEHVLSVIKDD